MQFSAKQTWWMTFALVAVQGLTTVGWNAIGLDPKIVAVIAQVAGYSSLLLTFAIQGTIPGVAPVAMPGNTPVVTAPKIPGDFPKAILLIAAVLVSLLAAGPAFAQSRPSRGSASEAAPAAISARPNEELANPLNDLAKKIAALSLADFKYAAALAHKTGNTVTAPCWDAWVSRLEAWQTPLTDANGQPIPQPDPHIITDVERLSEILADLQPNSAMSIACSPLAQATQKNISNLIGAILSGGALGLIKLPLVP